MTSIFKSRIKRWSTSELKWSMVVRCWGMNLLQHHKDLAQDPPSTSDCLFRQRNNLLLASNLVDNFDRLDWIIPGTLNHRESCPPLQHHQKKQHEEKKHHFSAPPSREQISFKKTTPIPNKKRAGTETVAVLGRTPGATAENLTFKPTCPILTPIPKSHKKYGNGYGCRFWQGVPTTWRIIPFSKCLGWPLIISHFYGHLKGVPQPDP